MMTLKSDIRSFQDLCQSVDKLGSFHSNLPNIVLSLEDALSEADILKLKLSNKEQQLAEFQAKLAQMRTDMKDLGPTNMDLSSINDGNSSSVEVFFY